MAPAIQIGPHRLYHGDAYAIRPTLGWMDADVMDPPYLFDNSGGGSLSYGFTNSGFFNCLSNFTPVGGTCSPNSGNYIMATATSTSGSLVNGTGKV